MQQSRMNRVDGHGIGESGPLAVLRRGGGGAAGRGIGGRGWRRRRIRAGGSRRRTSAATGNEHAQRQRQNQGEKNGCYFSAMHFFSHPESVPPLNSLGGDRVALHGGGQAR